MSGFANEVRGKGLKNKSAGRISKDWQLLVTTVYSIVVFHSEIDWMMPNDVVE